MKLPQAEQAIVLERKLTEYLLAPDHRSGQSKAEFFRLFGYSRQNWRSLEQALRDHALRYEVSATQARNAGMIYVVDGPLTTPDGRHPWVRAVWVVDVGEDVPRFITAYPLSRTGS